MSIFDAFSATFTILVSSWWFWLIFGLSFVASAVYQRLKKNRKAQKKQRKRFEKEVKQLLKKHLAKTAGLKDVTLSYVDVISRSGEQYNRRDVFDVFVKIYNKRVKNWKPIYKCYEIEGSARYADPKDKKSPVFIDWKINAEFDYENHKKLLKKPPW